MSSRPRFRAVPYALGCDTGKRMFATRPEAEYVVRWIRRNHDTQDSAYRCKRCGRWHVGER